jgi:flavoprotein
MKTVPFTRRSVCPHCGGATGHLATTYSHSTTDGAGRLKTVGKGYCSTKCAEAAGKKWRDLNVRVTAKDEAHGGKLLRMHGK